MIKAYDGENPFVFVSYSHKDWQRVSLFIKKLQDNLCHVWFDEGIKSGSVWNDDLAEHLIQSDVILLFLSSSLIESEFVLSEVNFGRNHNKKFLPVYLEPIELPIGLEFQLSTIQAIHLYQFDESEALKRIIKSLPDSVFLHTETPFYIDSNCKNANAVREMIKKEIIENRFYEAARDLILESSLIIASPEDSKTYVNNMVSTQKEFAEAEGISLSEYLDSYYEMTEEEFREATLWGYADIMILKAIAENENYQITLAERTNIIETTAEHVGFTPEEAVETYGEEYFDCLLYEDFLRELITSIYRSDIVKMAKM